MRPGMKWPRSLFACFAVASLFSSSVRVNPILILASRPRMRLGKLRRRRCAKLHGHLRAAPHLGPSLRTLFNSKIASNQQRLQPKVQARSEEHTSELQSQSNLVCRLLLEKKKKKILKIKVDQKKNKEIIT